MLKFFLSLLNMKIKYKIKYFLKLYYFFFANENFSKINVAQKYVAGNFDLNQSYLRKRGVQAVSKIQNFFYLRTRNQKNILDADF